MLAYLGKILGIIGEKLWQNFWHNPPGLISVSNHWGAWHVGYKPGTIKGCTVLQCM